MTTRVPGTLYLALGFLTATVLGLWLLPLGDFRPGDPPPSVLSTPPPTATPYDPTTLLAPLIDLALHGARDEAAIAVATGRAQDRATAAAALPTREAELIDRAARAVLVTMVPTAARVPTSPYRPCRDAAKDETCIPDTPTPLPTRTPPVCHDGTSREYGVAVCRNDPTATPALAPTSMVLPSPQGVDR